MVNINHHASLSALNLDGPRGGMSSIHVCDEQLCAALARRAARQRAPLRVVLVARVFDPNCLFTKVTAFASATIAAYLSWSCDARCKLSNFLNLRGAHVHGTRFVGVLMHARLRECEKKLGADGKPNVETREWAGKGPSLRVVLTALAS